MIELDAFREWVAKQLHEKACSRIKQLKKQTANSMFSEKKRVCKKYTVTEGCKPESRLFKKSKTNKGM